MSLPDPIAGELEKPAGHQDAADLGPAARNAVQRLAPRIDEDTRFLDLCAGTGAIGIEALSRGAAFATFVDRSRKACALIEENLDKLKVPEDANRDCLHRRRNFHRPNVSEGWDIVFFDPPYDPITRSCCIDFGLRKAICFAKMGCWSSSTTPKDLAGRVGQLRRWRILKQGETSLKFLRTQLNEDPRLADSVSDLGHDLDLYQDRA